MAMAARATAVTASSGVDGDTTIPTSLTAARQRAVRGGSRGYADDQTEAVRVTPWTQTMDRSCPPTETQRGSAPRDRGRVAGSDTTMAWASATAAMKAQKARRPTTKFAHGVEVQESARCLHMAVGREVQLIRLGQLRLHRGRSTPGW